MLGKILRGGVNQYLLFHSSKTHMLLSFSQLAYTRRYPSYNPRIRRDLNMQIYINLVLCNIHSSDVKL